MRESAHVTNIHIGEALGEAYVELDLLLRLKSEVCACLSITLYGFSVLLTREISWTIA